MSGQSCLFKDLIGMGLLVTGHGGNDRAPCAVQQVLSALDAASQRTPAFGSQVITGSLQSVLEREGEFLVVDRGGAGHNCDEYPINIRVTLA